MIMKLLKAATLVLAMLSSATAWAQWQGTWRTDYGQVKLRQADKFVYGDYGSWGTIAGIVSDDNRTLRGIYKRNDDRSTGFIEWKLTGATSFDGRWNSPNKVFPTVGKTGTPWTGVRQSGSRPALSVYRSTTRVGDFLRRQTIAFSHWARMSYYTRQVVLPADYETRRGLTPSKLKTAFEMQKIVRAVSKKGDFARSNGEAEARQAFKDMGFKMLGAGIIDPTAGNVAFTRAAVAMKGDAIVIAFRGTKGDTAPETAFTGLRIDGDIRLTEPSFITASRRGGAEVHQGFNDAYRNLRSQINAALDGQFGKHLFITGHSLGGALAQLAAWDMAANRRNDFRSITVITSGSPRVGNRAFADKFVAAVPDNLRIIVHRDPVPALPWRFGKFVHAGGALVIGKNDGVLIQHKDHEVKLRPALLVQRFALYHGNKHYYSAVRQLSQRGQSSSVFRPNGDRWAADAARSWYQLSMDERQRPRDVAKEKAQKAKEKGKKLLGKAKGLIRR